MKFIVDENLGKLAKWLRLAGFDCLYFNDIADARLVEYALKENRLLLTRDKKIPQNWTIKSVIIIEQDNPYKQITELAKRLGLELLENSFTRCVNCNTILKPIEKDKIRDRVPPFVYKTYDEFSYCQTCDKIYWRGTHFDSLVKRLEEIENTVKGKKRD